MKSVPIGLSYIAFISFIVVCKQKISRGGTVISYFFGNWLLCSEFAHKYVARAFDIAKKFFVFYCFGYRKGESWIARLLVESLCFCFAHWFGCGFYAVFCTDSHPE
jgi:hypothetical protein